jgi:hypothetical protein
MWPVKGNGLAFVAHSNRQDSGGIQKESQTICVITRRDKVIQSVLNPILSTISVISYTSSADELCEFLLRGKP